MCIYSLCIRKKSHIFYVSLRSQGTRIDTCGPRAPGPRPPLRLMYFLLSPHYDVHYYDDFHISLFYLLFIKNTLNRRVYFISVCLSVINTVCSTIEMVISNAEEAVRKTFGVV